MKTALERFTVIADAEFQLIRITDTVKAFAENCGILNGVAFVITLQNLSASCGTADILY